MAGIFDLREAPSATATIAIACYNHARFLAEAIESAISQTRPADEVIVVDDGSTDETRVVAARYPAVLYVHQANAGLSAARNAALRCATSGHILFLDADDRLLPDALRDAMAAFDAIPDAAFVYGDYREVDESGEVLWTMHPSAQKIGGFQGLLRGNFIAMHGTVLYDRARLLASGGFDTTLRSCEDYDVYLRLARVNRIGPYATCAADYRRHGDTMTGNNLRMIETVQTVLHRHERGLSADECAAWRQGFSDMTGFYADRLVQQVLNRARAGRFGEAMRLAVRGQAAERGFARRLSLRLAGALWGIVKAKALRGARADCAGDPT